MIRRLLPALGSVALLSLLSSEAALGQSGPPPLETVRNYQKVSQRLASSGQIGDEQIALIREQGYEVVVNLAVADEERNGREGFLVAQEGLTYVHIPVDWNAPSMADVEMFFDIMEANEDRKVYVHCFANMRASAFVYLYRTLVEGVPEAEARATMDEIWDPWELEQWGSLIERAQAEYGGSG
ncbi:MAG: protein tyrosine phosphatase family protein [Longimicrobiales bacterium]|nr:protein tyrosine phosphatase family protein [Longimicrobiales bacterium]